MSKAKKTNLVSVLRILNFSSIIFVTASALSLAYAYINHTHPADSGLGGQLGTLGLWFLLFSIVLWFGAGLLFTIHRLANRAKS